MDTGRSEDEDRLFALQGHSDDFYAGVLVDGRQVLMGVLGPHHIVAYVFSPEGVLLGREMRPLEGEPPRPGGTDPYLTRDPDYLENEWRQVSRWQEDLRFRPETIHVRAFTGLEDDFIEDDFIKVEAVPRYWLEVDPDECDEDREGRMRAIQEWEAAGNYVLWWHEPFHMSKEGEVVST